MLTPLHNKMAATSADLAALRAFLAATPLSDASPRRQELFTLEHSMTVAKALEVSSLALVSTGEGAETGSVPVCAWRESKREGGTSHPSIHLHSSLSLPARPLLAAGREAHVPHEQHLRAHLSSQHSPSPFSQSFQAKRILSAPLVVSPDLEDLEEAGLDGGGGLADPDATEAAFTPQLLGWVDTSDILRAFLSHLDSHLASTEATHRPPLAEMRMLELMQLLEKVGPGFAARPLVTVNDGGDRALLYQAGPQHSLLEVMRDQFLGGSRGGGGRAVHRVAIFDPHGEK